MLTLLHRSSFRLLSALIVAVIVGLAVAPAFSLSLMAQEDDGGDDASPVPAEASPAASPQSGSVTFIATADAYVMEQTPNENYGSRERLVADEEAYSSSYIRFEVTGVTRVVEKATLRLWVLDSTSHAPTLWLAPNVDWDEDEVTWNTRPALDRELEDKERGDTGEGVWIEYDVTSAVTGNGVYNFVLVPESTNGMDVASRESPDNKPELVLDLGGSAAAGGDMAPSEAPVLLAAGDIASCGSDGDSMTAAILDEEPGFIAMLGDAAYPAGTAEEFKDCYDPTWGQHRDRTMPAIGNHEMRTDRGQPYFDYFGPVAGDPDKGYYSYDLGVWHVVVLNTEIDISAGSEQEKWLREDLESNPAVCTLAYWHQPRWSSGEHGSNEYLDAFYTALYEHGVELVLSGHDHNYERFAPMDPDGNLDMAHGVRQFVVGTGGISLRPFGEFEANSEVRQADTHGILRLRLYADGYEWEFLAVEGKTFYDSGRDFCHESPEGGDEGAVQHGREVMWVAVDSRRSSRSFGRNAA